MMRHFLIVFLSSISFFSFGQQMGAYNDGTKVYYPYERFSLSVSPLALFDLYNGSAYKAGFSFRPTRKSRITADSGGYLSGFTTLLSPFDNMKGHHFRASMGASEDFFEYTPIGFGVTYDYKRQDFTFDSRTMTDQMDYTASVNKVSHIFSGYANLNLHFGWRFYIELRAELGMINYDNTNSHNHLLSDSQDWQTTRAQNRVKTQKGNAPFVALNVRFNYALWTD